MLDNRASIKQIMSIYEHTRMTSLTSFLRGCNLLSLLRPMLPSVGGFAISSDGYFLSGNTSKYFSNPNYCLISLYVLRLSIPTVEFIFSPQHEINRSFNLVFSSPEP